MKYVIVKINVFSVEFLCRLNVQSHILKRRKYEQD